MVGSGPADVERPPGALRDRWPPRRDELWRDCGRASPGDEAGTAGADRPAPALAEGALAVSRVGPRAEFELQRAVRRHSAAGYRDPPTRPDPRPDDRGGLLSTFRGVRRGRTDGGDQRGAPEVVARAGPRPVGTDGLHRCGRRAGADLRRAQGRDGDFLQRHLGLPSAGRVSGQHQGGALRRESSRERAEPHRRGALAGQGHRPADPPGPEGLPARRHGLLADRPLRPLGEAGGLRVRHGLQRRPAPSRRGSRRGGLATPGAQAEG